MGSEEQPPCRHNPFRSRSLKILRKRDYYLEIYRHGMELRKRVRKVISFRIDIRFDFETHSCQLDTVWNHLKFIGFAYSNHTELALCCFVRESWPLKAPTLDEWNDQKSGGFPTLWLIMIIRDPFYGNCSFNWNAALTIILHRPAAPLSKRVCAKSLRDRMYFSSFQ